jgi:hypothetical protein
MSKQQYSAIEAYRNGSFGRNELFIEIDERSNNNDEDDNPYSQNVADYYYDNDMDKQDYAHDYYSHPIDQNYGRVC